MPEEQNYCELRAIDHRDVRDKEPALRESFERASDIFTEKFLKFTREELGLVIMAVKLEGIEQRTARREGLRSVCSFSIYASIERDQDTGELCMPVACVPISEPDSIERYERMVEQGAEVKVIKT